MKDIYLDLATGIHPNKFGPGGSFLIIRLIKYIVIIYLMVYLNTEYGRPWAMLAYIF